jgi:hypothetical protein
MSATAANHTEITCARERFFNMDTAFLRPEMIHGQVCRWALRSVPKWARRRAPTAGAPSNAGWLSAVGRVPLYTNA